MRNLIFALLFVLILVIIVGNTRGQSVYDALNPFDNYATSTESGTPSLTDRIFSRDDDATKSPTAKTDTNTRSDAPSGTSNSPLITSKAVEEQAQKVLETLKGLKEEEKVDELRSPKSPYAGQVTLGVGKAKATDEDDEYVTLTAANGNTKDVYITGWQLESYVTESEGTIPLGARALSDHKSDTDEPILLKPGEFAYVITGATPLDVSFRENRCTGYLHEYGDFNPALKKNCPLASDELLLYGEDEVHEDDECFDYVAKINKCELVDKDQLDDAGLRSSCDAFILRVLDYEGCYIRHNEESGFYDGGAWRIYLDEDRELWRTTGEVVRLLDKEGRVVDIIEY